MSSSSSVLWILGITGVCAGHTTYRCVDIRCTEPLVSRPPVHSRAAVRRFPGLSTGLSTAFPRAYPQTCGCLSDTVRRPPRYPTHRSTALSPGVVHRLWTTFLEVCPAVWDRARWDRGRGVHDADCLIRLVSSAIWLNSVRRSAICWRIFRSACMTVVWSRPPKACPMRGSERSVSSRHRYMAT